jgi:hypothetical protein
VKNIRDATTKNQSGKEYYCRDTHADAERERAIKNAADENDSRYKAGHNEIELSFVSHTVTLTVSSANLS